MGTTPTDKQKIALENLLTGPGLIPIVHFGALRDAGYVQKATTSNEVNGKRGYSYAELTEKGRILLNA